MTGSEAEGGASKCVSGRDEAGLGAAEAAGAEFAVKLMEIAAGASISALLPLKALMNHLIATGVVDCQALLREMEAGLDVSRYGGWTHAAPEGRRGSDEAGARAFVRQGAARC